jgi:hypothetical protein
MLKFSVPTAFAIVMTTGGAWAAPAAGLSGPGPALVQQVRYDHGRKDYRGPPVHRYAPGAHLYAPPRGWHRYGRRPHDWRGRGCIVVGPVWFCP